MRPFADREGLADAAAVATDDNALEDLDTRARAFDDLHVDLEGVAGAEGRDVRTQAGCVNGVKLVHDCFSFSRRHRSPGMVFHESVCGLPDHMPSASLSALPLWRGF